MATEANRPTSRSTVTPSTKKSSSASSAPRRRSAVTASGGLASPRSSLCKSKVHQRKSLDERTLPASSTVLRRNSAVTTSGGIASPRSLTKAKVVQRRGSFEGTVHAIREEEKIAFSDWINAILGGDPYLAANGYTPIDPTSDSLFHNCKDGVLMCKLINATAPSTIDESRLNYGTMSKFKAIENINVMLGAARKIGCNVVNIGANEVYEGKEHLILSLLGQIIRIGLLNNLNIKHHPGLVKLLNDGEDTELLSSMTPEELLIRWVNYHLSVNTTCQRRVENFTKDLVDCEVYTYLLQAIAPEKAGVTLDPLKLNNNVDRAKAMLLEADKIGCRQFLRPHDVSVGNQRLNVAFVANLFNHHCCLDDTTIAIMSIKE